MSNWLGRLQAAVLGGLGSSLAVLLLACQWDIELLQSGSSSGRTLFFSTWLGTVLASLLLQRVRSIFSVQALLSGAATCLSMVIHHWAPGQRPFAGVDFTLSTLGLLLVLGGAWALMSGRRCA